MSTPLARGRSAALALLLAFLACQPPPSTVPAPPKEPGPIQDAWFGEGLRLAPHPLVEGAWAAPGLDLRGQVVELAPWEVPAAPAPGLAADAAWIEKRDAVTHVLQGLASEGVRLAQQLKPPPGAPPTHRLQGRVLAFDRQARVAAKAGQVLGNVVLVPVNLALTLVSQGQVPPVFFISAVSGYRTEALVQVKVVDLRTGAPVLALQSWLDFKSLEAPTHLMTALCELGGAPRSPQPWWPEQDLQKDSEGDAVWFKPGLDLRDARIRCLAWVPTFSARTQGVASVREQDLARGLRATRLPQLLAAPDDTPAGPRLSETEGTLHLQGQSGGPEQRAEPTCLVKLWDPATGEVLGLMKVAKGYWRRDLEQDWVRRIRRHLRAQRGPARP